MPRFKLAQQPGQFGDLARVPAREFTDVPCPARLPHRTEPVPALVRETDEPGTPVDGIGLTGDQTELLQGMELTGHRGLADADVRGQFGGARRPHSSRREEEPVRGGLQVGVDLSAISPEGGPGRAAAAGSAAPAPARGHPRPRPPPPTSPCRGSAGAVAAPAPRPRGGSQWATAHSRTGAPAHLADPAAALLGEVDEPGTAVGGVGLTGDEAELLQGAQLAGHGGLADADVGGQFGPGPGGPTRRGVRGVVRGGLQVRTSRAISPWLARGGAGTRSTRAPGRGLRSGPPCAAGWSTPLPGPSRLGRTSASVPSSRTFCPSPGFPTPENFPAKRWP